MKKSKKTFNILRPLIIISQTIFFVGFFLGGCRFTVPNQQETAALHSRGTFSAGSPPSWAGQSPDGTSGLPKNSGIVPETFGVPEAASFSATSSGSVSVSPNSTSPVINSKSINPVEISNKNNKQNNENETSPLKRIEVVCPEIEDQVISAIKIEDVEDRITKYELLTSTCSDSSDLWYWLAKDYAQVGNLSGARRSAQTALNIDPKNNEIKILLDSINSGKFKKAE